MELLTEYRLFKRRCSECLSVFYDRMKKGCNITTKDLITNREEKDFEKDAFAFDTVGSSAVNVRDDFLIVKEEAETFSGCSFAPEKDVELPMVASIQESENHWCSNVEAKNLDPLKDRDVSLSFNKEVDIKEDCHFDIPQDPLEDGGNIRKAQVAQVDQVNKRDGPGVRNVAHAVWSTSLDQLVVHNRQLWQPLC
ncbi:uncharacterized protein [Hetaerina americana]|uniref:uncharacterized protein n=1 Tax=Hetaerina americana TaxID=62018 RepID=UPI003A7F107C